MALIPVDSYYRSSWPSGWTNWHNHAHTTVPSEFNSDWTKYADNEFYFFPTETSAGTNGETMKQVNRYFAGGFQQDHFYATTDGPPGPGSGYSDEGLAGYIYQNDGDNRTALYRFVKYYNSTSGFGRAQTSGTLVTNTNGVVKRVKLRSGINGASNIISCNNPNSGIFCYVESYRDTNTQSATFGCAYPFPSAYIDMNFSNITGSGSGLTMHMEITPINGTGGNPNNMRVTYPGTWFNSGGGSFGEGGVYVSGGSGYAVGNLLNPITWCTYMGSGAATAFEVTQIGTISTSQTIISNYDRIDHRCGTTNINGIDGWVYEGIMGYVPLVKTGCTNSTANNYDAFANQDTSPSSCIYIVAPTTSITATNSSNVAVSSIYKGQSVNITYSSTTGNDTLTTSFTATAGGVETSPIATPGNSGTNPFSPIVETTYEFIATNSVGSSDSSVTVDVINDDPVVSLTSNATDDTIKIGDEVTLTWSATSNQSITSASLTDVSNPGASGSEGLSPSSTKTYTYSATNPSGTTDIDIDITVIQLPVVSLTSNDADNTIIKGQSVDLTWSATSSNPSGYNITDTSMTGVTTPGLSGTTTVTPGVTTTYTYTATNYAGTVPDTETITVEIIPPVVSLTSDATDDTITRPGSVTLTWSASATGNDITSTSLVDNNGNVIVENPGTSGDVLVTPDYDTTYTYSATNPSGTTDADRPITVILPPPVVTLDIVDSGGNVLTDNTIIEGESLFLRWNTDGFDIVSTDLSNYSEIPGVSGTETFSPTIETEYVYSATNASGTDTTSITIIVYYPPVLTVSTSVEDAEGVSTIDLFDSVNIIWSTVGDGGTVTWTSGSPAITSTAGAGDETVTPLPASIPTETYCGIPSGLGGIGDEQCVTITVIPPPPEITEFFADPNPQNSLGGTPLYSTELNWDSDGYGDITGTITSDAGESFDVDAFGTLDITNLPQSDAPSTSPATRSYFLTLSNSGGSDTDNITVSSRNDNTPTNTWNTSFLNLEPSTTVTVVIGTISGVDMITEVSTSESVSFIGFSGAFSSTRSFSNGQAVQLKTVTMPFNTDTSGLPAGSEFGKTNTKTVVVETENGSIDVTFTTKAPTIKEGFDLSSTINKYPYEDIDLIANLPTEFTTTDQIPMDQIEIDQEVKVDDPNAQISINNGEWQNVREI